VLQRTTLCLIAGPTQSRRVQVKRRDRPTSRRYFIYISFVPLVNPTARHSVPAAGRRAGDDAATAGWTPGGGGGDGEQVGIVGTTDLRQRRHRRRRQRRRNVAACTAAAAAAAATVELACVVASDAGRLRFE